MSIYTAILSSLLAFNSCLLWAKMTSKSPSPVSFETNHAGPLAFWIAREYGPKSLYPRHNRKQRVAISVDKLFGNEHSEP